MFTSDFCEILRTRIVSTGGSAEMLECTIAGRDGPTIIKMDCPRRVTMYRSRAGGLCIIDRVDYTTDALNRCAPCYPYLHQGNLVFITGFDKKIDGKWDVEGSAKISNWTVTTAD